MTKAYSHCSVAAGKAGSKVREAIFKYLERCLKELGPERAQKYCAQVINTCLFAYKREDSNPAKSATFLPLQCILDWRLSVPDDSTASELARAYQSSYQRLKSLTGTVKGDILQTLGQLLEARPQVRNPAACQSLVVPRATNTLLTPAKACLVNLKAIVHQTCLSLRCSLAVLHTGQTLATSQRLLILVYHFPRPICSQTIELT